jgi:hypothetical protein
MYMNTATIQTPGRHEDRQPVVPSKNRRQNVYLVLEHVEQRGLASVVEAEEEDLGLLLPEPQGDKQVVKPIHQKHRRRRETGTALRQSRLAR